MYNNLPVLMVVLDNRVTAMTGQNPRPSRGDPSMWSSQNEQDNRYYGLMALIPVFEPFDPQSAHDLTVKAFEFSAKVKHPVLLVSNTRVNHSRTWVNVGVKKAPVWGKLNKKPQVYSLVPSVARANREKQLKRWELITEEVKEFNVIEGDGKKLIITAGEATRTLRITSEY